MINRVSKLTDLTNQRASTGYQPYSVEAYKWFVSKVNNLRNPVTLANQIKKEGSRNTNRFVLGGLYFFYYNAKTADRLSYWDAFPMVMPLQRYNDGFLGLNFHYLPPRVRAGFMDKLLDRSIRDEDDNPTRVRISYEVLDAAKRYKEFRPCLKRYLYSGIASKILKVQPNEWETAVFLPTQQFQKARSSEVWQESMKEIRNDGRPSGFANTTPTIGQV
jgi:hypothetical protein